MRTLHLISHTHWDREWYLTFQQFRLKLVHLMDGLLELLANDPDYRHFILDGQTIILDDYLALHPEREANLRRHVSSGRLHIGPWYILPDTFLVSPEAHLRNLLQGDRTASRFGAKMMVGYIPDPFGHIGQMPQILCGFDIQLACLQRGLADEPCELWWEAPDGSRVLTAYLRDGYGNAASLPTQDSELFIREVRRVRDSLLPHSTVNHLLLMQGTDHMEPPADTSRALAAARGRLDGDRLIHSTLSDYFKALHAEITKGHKHLPVVRGELRQCKRHHLLPGVLSARIWIKQRNHACETLLERWAEPFSTWAENTHQGTPGIRHFPTARLSSPAIALRHAWRLLMECHPHDSICGCSIDQVHEEMRPRFDQVEQIGTEITRQSLESLAAVVNSQPPAHVQQADAAIIVFNPTSLPRTDRVNIEFNLPPGVGDFDLFDHAGNILPYQTEGLGSRELINLQVTRNELAGLIGNIHDGRFSNFAIQELLLEQRGEDVYIEALFAENAEPNPAVWEQGSEKMKSFLGDPAIQNFHIRARSTAITRLAFIAKDIPGLGWRTYWLQGKPPKESIQPGKLARLLMPIAVRLSKSSVSSLIIKWLETPRDKPPIENEYFRVDVLKDGTLELIDKRSGLVYSHLNRFVDGGDCGDEYNYCPPQQDGFYSARLKHARVRRAPIQQSLELALELKIPLELDPDRKTRAKRNITLQILCRVTLTQGVPRVDVHTEIDNLGRDHRLRVHFPAPFMVDHAHHDGHFEVIQRPIGCETSDGTWVEQPRPEVPQRAFTSISDGKNGLTIANRGLPEVEVATTQNTVEIALTLLRCVGWLSRDDFPTRKGQAGPKLATPEAQLAGHWQFDYSIIPHHGEWDNGYAQALAFQTQPRGVGTSIHNGLLPASGSFIRVEPESFIISAVKTTEDDEGWLVRGYNISSADIEVTLLPWRKFKQVELVNLRESKIKRLRTAGDGRVTLRVRGHQIITVAFRD